MQQILDWNVRQTDEIKYMIPGTLAGTLRSVPGVAMQPGHTFQRETGSRDYAAIASGSRRTVAAGSRWISTSAVV